MQTKQLEVARERVCQNLLDRLLVMDKMLEEAELEDNKVQLRKVFKLQTNTLYRLERLLAWWIGEGAA